MTRSAPPWKRLTLVLAVLIVVAAAPLIIVRVTRPGATSAAAKGTSPPSATSATSPVTDVPPTSGATTASTAAVPTTVAPTSTTAPSPLALLTTGLDSAVGGTNACLFVTGGAGQTLYQHQPDTSLIPASTQKLLVAAAALTTLGPSYRFTTKVMASAPPVAGKVGDLWLVGGGDPLLATPEFVASTAGKARVAGFAWTSLAQLSDALATAGIKVVTGTIHGDDSFEDRLRFLPVWPPSYRPALEIGLLSALGLNEGIQLTTPKVTLAPDPPAFAASELARLLQGHRVAVTAGADQAAPAGARVLATVSSAQLVDIVEAMLRASDNWIAELLVRAIDKAAGGAGTTAGGTAVVLRDAAAAGVPVGGVQMDDGSGLSPTDRATCRELLAALDLGDQPAFAPLQAGLAIAGRTGTLADRYWGTPLAGALRAKTGSLDYVAGMVGIVDGPSSVRFAYLVNGIPDPALYPHEDAVVGVLGDYARAAPGG